tara:strand:+ start:3471 stop:4649 length:1179 start_codon:yes stop_codon:yes gene_type:complete
MNKKFDIIIYGATGFTGSLCAKYLKENHPNLRWGVAGRNKEKLEELSKNLGLDCQVFVADGNDASALNEITKQTKVVLTTAGPFHRYGSKLVASCVTNSTHYVDITGENFWVKQMIEKHHEEAKRKGVRIIPSCGYDSIPSDLGCFFAAKSFGKKVGSIHSFHTWKGEASGGTIETMFSTKSSGADRASFGRFALNPKGSVSKKQKKLTSDKVSVGYSKAIGAWVGPFIMAMANTRVVRRGAALLEEIGEGYGKNFVYKEHAYYSSRAAARKTTFFLGVMGVVLLTPLSVLVRPFLKKPGQGPSQKVMDGGFFKCKLVVVGEDGDEKIYEVRASGDPGYKVTSKLVCESAVCLLGDHSLLPGGSSWGGVLTASSGLGGELIKRLKNVGVVFE